MRARTRVKIRIAIKNDDFELAEPDISTTAVSATLSVESQSKEGALSIDGIISRYNCDSARV